MARKRVYQIVNRDQRRITNVNVDGKDVKIHKRKGTYVTDTGLAEEIDRRYGMNARTDHRGKIMVIPVDDHDPTYDEGHVWTHTVPSLSGMIGWDGKVKE